MAVERYRSYLLLLARMHVDARPNGGIEASDIVQQTMLEAHAKQDQFTGDEAGLAAWLRTALANNIRDALRKMRRKRRDVARVRSLEEGIEASSARLSQWLAADQTSPSQQVANGEDVIRLADALQRLPEAQREAVVLHHLHGCTLRDVARQLDRTEAAVAGLLHRGLRALRELLAE